MSDPAVAGRDHWERVWQKSREELLSWYQAEPAISLGMIRASVSGPEARILDVGGGASRLVDRLLDAGHDRPGVLDISEAALTLARERLGVRAGAVEWYRTDVRDFVSPHAWDVWHDRAVFHFLTDAAERAAYRNVLRRTLAPGGHVIIATFGPTGPERCSGLPAVRYSCEALGAELGDDFELRAGQAEAHTTPAGKTQNFVYCRFRRRDDRAGPGRRSDKEAVMQMESQDLADAQESLEAVIKGEVLRMYQEVAEHPETEFHFYHGRQAAEMFGYEPEWLDRAPPEAVASFAGVGNPHERSALKPGETVLDLGSGAGLDAIIAGWQVGPTGTVIGLDMNPAMCHKAEANAAASGTSMECRQGRMEDIPLADESVDIVLSNGVINLSFRKRRVIRELFRVLKPGGRISITDIVSAKQLSQSIVNDPKLWAS